MQQRQEIADRDYPMFSPDLNAPLALDVTTLLIVATCITALLGLLLLSAWAEERIPALAWWGSAYLLGAFAGAIWSLESIMPLPLPRGTASALLFVACAMIWNAARLFHGRRVLWGAMFAGALVWLIGCATPDFAQSLAARIALSSVIVSGYTFLTAAELWRERRNALQQRWPALCVPFLHGAIFLFPVPAVSLLPHDGTVSLATGWIAVFALEIMLYAVGTAFIILTLASERSVRLQRDAASTDDLTGLLNRRGFQAAARELVARQAKSGGQISVLVFDLDHFKSINDRFGHLVGDQTLRTFAATAAGNMRSSDVVARFGGEEFAAMLPGSLADATTVAERVRMTFAALTETVCGHPVGATVSVGAASAEPGADVGTLLAAADRALYRAKGNGRNCVEQAQPMVTAPTLAVA